MLEKKLKKLQKSLSRKVKFSKNWYKQRSKISKIRKILFFKDNVSFHYEDISQSMKKQDVKPLKLKDVSDRVLSLACYVSEIL